MKTIQLVLELNATHDSLYAVNGNERLLLASVALCVTRDNPVALDAWRILCAAALKAVEEQVVES